jgi:hypothetical protein
MMLANIEPHQLAPRDLEIDEKNAQDTLYAM